MNNAELIMCNDNRFELVAKYKAKLIESTNIGTSADEMAVIDNILFRMWQMGWLDRLEQPTVDAVSCEGCTHKGKWENEYENGYPSPCTKCKRRALDNWERMDGERSEDDAN